MIIFMRLILFLLFLLAIYWPVIAYRHWSSPWRFAALGALVFPVVFVARVIIHLLTDPPVYSLSIGEFALATFASLGIMIVATIWRSRRKLPQLRRPGSEK
jgi:hypothetical protein